MSYECDVCDVVQAIMGAVVINILAMMGFLWEQPAPPVPGLHPTAEPGYAPTSAAYKAMQANDINTMLDWLSDAFSLLFVLEMLVKCLPSTCPSACCL